jgi:hypothetical protein
MDFKFCCKPYVERVRDPISCNGATSPVMGNATNRSSSSSIATAIIADVRRIVSSSLYHEKNHVGATVTAVVVLIPIVCAFPWQYCLKRPVFSSNYLFIQLKT